MKISILSLFGIFLFAFGYTNADWTKVSSLTAGIGANIYSQNSTLLIAGKSSPFKFYRSSNNGAAWDEIQSQFPYDVYNLHNFNNEIFAITTILGKKNYDFYVSQDEGKNWAPRSSIPSVTGNGAILSMSSDGSTLYAVSNRKSYYISQDKGATWTEKIISTTLGGNLVSFAGSGSNLFAVILGSGSLVSSDNGQSWNLKNPGSVSTTSVYNYKGRIYSIPSGGPIAIYNTKTNNWDLAKGLPEIASFEIPKSIHGYGNKLYVLYIGFMTSQATFYESSDEGANWSKLTTVGLPATANPGAAVSSFTVNTSGIYFYNMVQNGTVTDEAKTGIFYLPLDGNSINDSQISENFHLSNFPNPFTHSTKIQYNIETAEQVDIEVFDIFGNSVDKLVDAYHLPGNYSVLFEPAKFSNSNSTYYCRIRSGNKYETRSMILQK